jgi:peptidoglycan/LPS O-acetylase OafA/YrhL
MPEPVKRNQRYMPGLDGLRAIAVLAVVAFHLEFGWAPGGLLGVGIFFTLSGYLITDILLSQLSKIGKIKLGGFWLARARRLLPALFVMLALVLAWVTIFGPAQTQQFRDSVISAVFYVNNWQQVFGDVSYFARFEAPGPLNHLWSLAVEEQFYIVWPFLLLFMTKVIRDRDNPGGVRPKLAMWTLGLGLLSAILMAVIYKGGGTDPSRVYYGTDTRAFELLFGAALAMVWPSRRLSRKITPQARKTLDGLGVLGLLVIAIMIWKTSELDAFLYRGGFVLLSLAVILVLMAATHPACRLGILLGVKPLRWVGVRSYGIYLWHAPVIVLTNPSDHPGPSLTRAVLQVAAIFAISALSWKFIEEPIRHGAFGKFFARRRARGWGWTTFSPPGRAAIIGSAVVLIAALVGMAGVNSAPEGADARVAEAVKGGTAKKAPLTPKQAAESDKTSCKKVIHIGDSTSEGLDSPEYLPIPSQRIDAQYEDVGTKEEILEISGARSIEEQFEGEPNAQEVAEAWKLEGFEGCWVLAMGTNEAANVAAGSTVGERERIDKMMAIIGDEPAMWVNVRSIVPPGDPYSKENMEKWDEELVLACAAYPNMRIYDWASDVKDAWFIEDGIHFTSPGYAARSQLIAQALAHAFPAKGETQGGSKDCVVS